MTEETSKQDSFENSLDLSGLTDFQFGPAWARKQGEGDKPRRADFSSSRNREERGSGRPRREGGFAERAGGRGGERRQGQGFRGDRRDRTTGREDRREDGQGGNRFRQDRTRERGGRFERSRQPREELAEPTPGLRVELRPVDVLLSVWAAEVNKHKRVVSLFDFAKVVMGGRDRYDLVYMKQEDGPQLIQSKKDGKSCWVSREEAIRSLWGASWFDDFYKTEEESVEPPKGDFKGIAKCRLSGDLIGPVNWHGYQSAVLALHRDKFSHMPVEEFRHTIEIVKDEEVIQQWLDGASRRVVWKPVREGAEEVVLEDRSSVEKDFDDNHFDAAFTVCDKVFVNGSADRKSLSPGLWAHLVKLAETTRKHPSMLIPNLCHGLARHHMPIFKWKGGHHTGPSRPRIIPEGTVLADNMMAILNWARDHVGTGVDVMLNELGGVLPLASEEGNKKARKENNTSEPALVDSEKAESVVEEPVVATVVEESADGPSVDVEETPEPAVAETTDAVEAAPVEEPAEVDSAEEASAPTEISSAETPAVEESSEDSIRTKRQELVRDTLWLCEQGYVLVFADRTIRLPKATNEA